MIKLLFSYSLISIVEKQHTHICIHFSGFLHENLSFNNMVTREVANDTHLVHIALTIDLQNRRVMISQIIFFK